ncbi:hypothetical protein FACS1894110_11810 [Spirochaetia bacterium]|nr:hypothetical protein FACS1894110_11810 [Spirochaetia bacterium]
MNGLIKVSGGDVVAAARNGDILKANTSSVTTVAPTGQRMTGAIARWGDGSGDKLLLLGIQPATGDSDINAYGYREIVLSGGNLTGAALQKPGTGDPSSVRSENNGADKYDVTIGPRPVNHLFQAPDGILFAAIQGTGASTDGLEGGVWSYRNNEWNAEE